MLVYVNKKMNGTCEHKIGLIMMEDLYATWRHLAEATEFTSSLLILSGENIEKSYTFDLSMAASNLVSYFIYGRKCCQPRSIKINYYCNSVYKLLISYRISFCVIIRITIRFMIWGSVRKSNIEI